MKSLAKLAVAVVLLANAAVAHAEWVSGHFRSNGTYVSPYYRSDNGYSYRSDNIRSTYDSSSSYVYRNPYAANPSVEVSGYTRNDGTYVLPHYRTPANQTETDNLNYRGYGTIRVPRY